MTDASPPQQQPASNSGGTSTNVPSNEWHDGVRAVEPPLPVDPEPEVEFLNLFGDITRRLGGVPCLGHEDFAAGTFTFHRERECASSVPLPVDGRCPIVAGRCEKDADHEGDHYTTYRPEIWGCALAASPAPAPLDVERLARAWERAGYGEVTGDIDEYQEWGGIPREIAQKVAAEYARLQSEPTDPEPGA